MVGSVAEGLMAPWMFRLSHVSQLQVDQLSTISRHANVLRTDALVDHVHLVEAFKALEDSMDDCGGLVSDKASAADDLSQRDLPAAGVQGD